MFKYWKIAELDDYPYPWIYCPEMDNPHGMGTIREGYKEFKRFEEHIKTKWSGWIACTKIECANVMKFMGKVGAQPFDINVKENKIWFFKNLEKE